MPFVNETFQFPYQSCYLFRLIVALLIVIDKQLLISENLNKEMQSNFCAPFNLSCSYCYYNYQQIRKEK